MELPPLPQEVEAAIARLAAAGIRAWLVGGAPRDLLCARVPRDFDLVVDAPLERVRRALPGAVAIAGVRPLVLLPGPPRIEIAGFRDGADSLEADLRLRDFGVNAIAFEVGARRFIDPMGGRADLAQRQLRSPEPDSAFRSDPLRVLRAARLAADFGLQIESATRLAMERDAWRLTECAGERVRDELLRLLELDDVAEALRELRNCGGLAVVLPELLRTVGVAQNRHHIHDVFTHSLRVCELVPARGELRLAALLHDAAKPESKLFSDHRDDFSFLRHDLLAAPATRAVATRLVLSHQSADRLERLVRHHLLYPDRLATAAAIRRMLRRVGTDLLEDLLALRRADLASREDSGSAPALWLETEREIARVIERDGERMGAQLALSGSDVMRELDIGPGAEVGRWIERMRQRVVEQPDMNRRDQLLRWLHQNAGREDN